MDGRSRVSAVVSPIVSTAHALDVGERSSVVPGDRLEQLSEEPRHKLPPKHIKLFPEGFGAPVCYAAGNLKTGAAFREGQQASRRGSRTSHDRIRFPVPEFTALIRFPGPGGDALGCCSGPRVPPGLPPGLPAFATVQQVLLAQVYGGPRCLDTNDAFLRFEKDCFRLPESNPLFQNTPYQESLLPEKHVA